MYYTYTYILCIFMYIRVDILYTYIYAHEASTEVDNLTHTIRTLEKVRKNVHTFVFMYVYICIYIYIYTYLHIHIGILYTCVFTHEACTEVHTIHTRERVRKSI